VGTFSALPSIHPLIGIVRSLQINSGVSQSCVTESADRAVCDGARHGLTAIDLALDSGFRKRLLSGA
jgi:hypothetical protein